jgi:hypothetical protein
MTRLFNLLQRALALYAVRCLEIQLQDQTDALQTVRCVETFRQICTAREQTQRALLDARRHYLGLLKPGHCPTWRIA